MLENGAEGAYPCGKYQTQDGAVMGINSESEIAANLQIGPTTLGMVRIYVAGDGLDLPLDFDPDEAEEIAEELRSAAAAARKIQDSARSKKG
jgi:hypothetical protein